MIIWLIGLSGAGKTTIANVLYRRLKPRLPQLVQLDGDNLREVWGDQLGHDLPARALNAHRISHLCRLLDNQGLPVIASVLSNFPEWQRWNRENFSRYFEVYLDVGLPVVEARDTKGIYSAFRQGREKNVIGLDIPFQPPLDPDLVLDSSGGAGSPEDLADEILAALPEFDGGPV